MTVEPICGERKKKKNTRDLLEPEPAFFMDMYTPRYFKFLPFYTVTSFGDHVCFEHNLCFYFLLLVSFSFRIKARPRSAIGRAPDS